MICVLVTGVQTCARPISRCCAGVEVHSISFFIDFVCLPLWFSGLCKQWLRNHCGDDGQSDLHSISPHGSPPAHIISAVRLASTAVSSADGVTDGTASIPGTT